MNKYPAKPMMDEMAKYGRYGDSMLVHMNPIEVAGIASLSPTGRLTTNPVTGQPEAFLPLLAPALGILGGALKLGTLGTAALTGIGTAAITGDLKRGLVSGLTAGVSSGIGDLLTEGAQAGVEAATGELASLGAEAASGAAAQAGTTSADALMQSSQQAAADAAAMGLPGAPGAGLTSADMSLVGADASGLAPPPGPSGFETFSGRVDDLVGGLGTQGQLVGGLVGSSMLEQMDVQDDYEAQQRALEQESEEKRMRAYQDLQGAYRAAQPGVASGMSPMRAGISNLIPPPYVPGMAEGGETSPLVVEPTEEEALVLAKARQGALSPEDQVILQGYYSRRNEQIAASEQAEQEAADAERGVVDGVFRIPAGATNKEALDALYRVGLVSQGDYNWFSTHLRRTDNEGSQYLASESFPGLDTYLSQNTSFNDENKQKVTRILTALGQAQSEEGIPEEDLNYLTEGVFTNFNFFGGRGNAGYGGIDPISIQAGLRGRHSVAPPPDYMTGFEPEFSYFQDDPENIRIPTRMFRPTTSGIDSEGDYFDPILDKEAYLEQLRDYYRRLANYTPAEVDYPEESDPIEDDPDPVGDDPNTGDPEEGYPDVGDPEDPVFNPIFERGVSLVTGKRWKDMTEPERIVHAYMRGESSWYGDKEGSPAWDEAMAYIDEKFGDRVEEYKTAYRNEAIERAMAGNAGFSVEDMLRNAGYADLDQYMQSDTSALQRELLGDRDYFSRDENYTMPSATATTAQSPTQAVGFPDTSSNSFVDRARRGELTREEIEAFNAEFEKSRAGRNRGGLTFGGESVTNDDGSVTFGGLTFTGTAKDYAEGGMTESDTVVLRTPLGEESVQGGGIANVPTGMNAAMPTEEEFNMVAAAIMGMTEEADAIIDMFVKKYGSEMFVRLRDMILKQGVPGAQTEGMIEGPGGGMDDMVGGMIGAEQPVAVSPGEYIVPADVVSGLGDGSSDAGARELDSMMDRVRMARGGTTRQAPPIDASRIMPA